MARTLATDLAIYRDQLRWDYPYLTKEKRDALVESYSQPRLKFAHLRGDHNTTTHPTCPPCEVSPPGTFEQLQKIYREREQGQ